MERLFRSRNGVKEYFTDEEVIAHVAQQDENAAVAFNHQRINDYGAVGDQLGMLFDELKATGVISLAGPWAKHIQAVKDANPKPEAN